MSVGKISKEFKDTKNCEIVENTLVGKICINKMKIII
jgi:hypothetical protein